MASNTRNKRQIEENRAEIASLYLRQLPLETIAEKIGIERTIVRDDLTVIRKRWQDSAVRDLDAAKDRELVKVDNLEREYWDAWQRSKESRETSLTETTDHPGPVPTGDAPADTPVIVRRGSKVSLRRESTTGEAVYLHGVAWCIERRCKLLGLDKLPPPPILPGSTPENPVYTRQIGNAADLDLLTPAELDEMSERLKGELDDLLNPQ